MGAFSLHVFILACCRASWECIEGIMRSLFMHWNNPAAGMGANRKANGSRKKNVQRTE